jgi:hypothetical protein
MKPFSKTTPPDPLDELLAAALLGDLTREERTQLEFRLSNDPAAQAAYQETQRMHDLLEKNYREAQPDPAFEQRTISGVRRKIQHEKQHRETAWESAVVLWRGVRGFLVNRWVTRVAFAGAFLLIAGLSVQSYIRERGHLVTGLSPALDADDLAAQLKVTENDLAEEKGPMFKAPKAPASTEAPPLQPMNAPMATAGEADVAAKSVASTDSSNMVSDKSKSVAPGSSHAAFAGNFVPAAPLSGSNTYTGEATADNSMLRNSSLATRVTTQNGATKSIDSLQEFVQPAATTTPQGGTIRGAGFNPPGSSAAVPAPEPSRKLIRNAQLDLEVTSFQTAVDAVTAMAKAGGGYVDSSNSQRGGNGKLQGMVVVKVLPENLDAFLLKLRDLGEIKNQSVSTEDVTKAYFDTEARLENSRRMETQLQALLQRDNGKVSELLQVERELGRVRGEIEQMQGELKLYDFEVQYATVTLTIAEKNLNHAAAYLLRETDTFSLFAPDVESTFQQARQAAADFKANVLNANLNHSSPTDISATLVISVPPDQIEGFLARVKTLGRTDNFTRETERVARDGGNTDEPADETKTDKDRVTVNLTISSDNENPQEQTQLAVIASGDIDAKAQEAKQDAAQAGAAVTASGFERQADGSEAANLTFRLPVAKAPAFLETLKGFGKVESLTVHRDDQTGAGPEDENAPAEIDLRLHNATANEQTQLSVVAGGDVDAKAQEAKQDAAQAGAAVTASSFARETDGTEMADLAFRLPLGKAPAFLETLKKLGRVESLTVHRDDQPGEAQPDENAPADINLHLHNETAIVADDNGLWATLRRTFGEGIAAFLGSAQTIGVVVAFMLPWLVALVALAWMGRRIYVARRK